MAQHQTTHCSKVNLRGRIHSRITCLITNPVAAQTPTRLRHHHHECIQTTDRQHGNNPDSPNFRQHKTAQTHRYSSSTTTRLFTERKGGLSLCLNTRQRRRRAYKEPRQNQNCLAQGPLTHRTATQSRPYNTQPPQAQPYRDTQL